MRKLLYLKQIVGVATVFLATQSAVAGTGFTISSEATQVVVKYDGKLVTNYVLDQANKPYFWPLIGPTGKRMTRSFPMEDVEGERTDHPHHRSVWFGHQGVGGFDTWTEKATSKKKGAEHEAFLAGLGSTVHRSFSEISANEDRAVIRSSNDYLDSKGNKLMADERSMIFRMSNGQLILDFDITLIGEYGDIELTDKKDAGLCVRIPTSMTLKDGDGRIVNSEGVRDGDTWSKRAKWVDYYGTVDGELLGVAFLYHPSSFRSTTRWHVRDYGLFTANPFGPQSLVESDETGTFTLKAGERATVRHRIIFHKGDEKTAKIADAYEAYTNQ